MLTVGSLFSGVGGLDLGLERTGKFKVIWQCEIDAYCSEVLKMHWPEVPNYGDITKVRWEDVERPDVICGGAPCQPVSVAGKRKAQKDARWLWPEFARALRILRPRYALLENVPGLLTANGGDAFGEVLGDLAELRYAAEWKIISARECGALHLRKRVFVIAYPNNRGACGQEGQEERRRGMQAEPDDNADASNMRRERIQGQWEGQVQEFPEFSWCKDIRRIEDLRGRPDIPLPLIRRESDGTSGRLDSYIRRERTKAVGNSVVPACAELAGRRILELEEEKQNPKEQVRVPQGEEMKKCPRDADTSKCYCKAIDNRWGFICTRKRGHTGEHHAHEGTTNSCLAVWLNEKTETKEKAAKKVRK